MREKFNHLDLFSGIGGFALGARMAGIRVAHRFFSDINEHANSIYKKNFPAATPLGDIHQINGHGLRRRAAGPWIVTGGFPRGWTELPPSEMPSSLSSRGKSSAA